MLLCFTPFPLMKGITGMLYFWMVEETCICVNKYTVHVCSFYNSKLSTKENYKNLKLRQMKRINIILYVVLSTDSAVELTIVCADLDMANTPYSQSLLCNEPWDTSKLVFFCL